MINQAQVQLEEIIQKGVECREQELLDHHEIEVGNETIKEKIIQ